uniref:Large ribosomal subunit protein uL29 n=1 Tax=Apteryx owenii TaxID=8824 RepID=A0A8B9PN31_APTOW
MEPCWKEEEELLMQLDDQKMQRSHVCVAKVMGETNFKFSKVRVVCKSIAREENLRELYKGRKHKTLEQRAKLTRTGTRRQRRKGKIRGEVDFVTMWDLGAWGEDICK